MKTLLLLSLLTTIIILVFVPMPTTYKVLIGAILYTGSLVLLVKSWCKAPTLEDDDDYPTIDDLIN